MDDCTSSPTVVPRDLADRGRSHRGAVELRRSLAEWLGFGRANALGRLRGVSATIYSALCAGCEGGVRSHRDRNRMLWVESGELGIELSGTDQKGAIQFPTDSLVPGSLRIVEPEGELRVRALDVDRVVVWTVSLEKILIPIGVGNG